LQDGGRSAPYPVGRQSSGLCLLVSPLCAHTSGEIMSDQTEPLPVVPAEPAAPKKSHGVVAIVASVVAVVVLAGGGFAAWQFFAGGGPRPAEVLPASTFAVVSVDLDPSGGQKIEAIKTLRKFPSFREHTGVRPDSDVVKAIWDDTVGKECKDVDYAEDVKPWIGQRAAFGGVELDKGKPLPVVAVQVSDRDAASKGFAKLAACAKKSGEDDFGYSVGDDYALISDSTAHAAAILAAGKSKPLSEDASYQKWTDEAGGPGILNGYLSPNAGTLLKGAFADELGSADKGAKKQLDKAIDDFKGAGATLQFKDSGLELSMAGGGLKQVASKDVGEHVSALPEDTAALLAGAVDGKKIADSLDGLLEGAGSAFGVNGDDAHSMIEREIGLRLPDDVVTLLGDSFSISLGGDAPADLDKVESPADVPVGFLVRGDDAKVKDIVDRVQARTGTTLDSLPATFDTADGKAVLATNPDYAKQLLGTGSLGDDATFKDVVPHADGAPFVAYLSLDNGWSKVLADAARSTGDKDEREFAADLEVFKALGLSAWNDGTTSRALLRITAK
jgi:Protein of unknown function (DUF3352)